MTLVDTLVRNREWEQHPFGRIAPRVQESGSPELDPLSVFLDEGVVPRSSRMDNFNRLGDDLSKYLVVRPGDIVFNKLRTWQGGLGVSRYHGIVSPAYFVCRPQAGYEPRYLHYLLRSSPYLQELTRISKWMPPSQFDISWEQLRLVPILSPPKSVQRAIADYLDTETAGIDAFIEKKQRLVNLLEERVENLIRERIADSTLVRSKRGRPAILIKRVLAKVSRPALPSSEVITAFRDGQVTARSIRRVEGYTESWSENSRLQGVRRDDVVIHGLDGFAGAIGTSEVDGACSPVYHVCEPRDGGDSVYLGRLLRILAVSGYLGQFASSTRERAVDFRNWDLFGRIPVPNVDVCEQRAIAHSIRMIAPLRVAVERSAELAVEHRHALVTAAVTGELDIPGVAA